MKQNERLKGETGKETDGETGDRLRGQENTREEHGERFLVDWEKAEGETGVIWADRLGLKLILEKC